MFGVDGVGGLGLAHKRHVMTIAIVRFTAVAFTVSRASLLPVYLVIISTRSIMEGWKMVCHVSSPFESIMVAPVGVQAPSTP